MDRRQGCLVPLLNKRLSYTYIYSCMVSHTIAQKNHHTAIITHDTNSAMLPDYYQQQLCYKKTLIQLY